MESIGVQDWAVDRFSQKPSGEPVLIGTSLYRANASTMDAILEIDRRMFHSNVRPATGEDFASSRYRGVTIIPPECKDWVLTRAFDGGEGLDEFSRTHRNTTLDEILSMARKEADGVSHVVFRPAFPDDIARELSPEDWERSWKTYADLDKLYEYNPTIYAVLFAVALAVVSYFITEPWRLVTAAVAAVAAIRVVYRIGYGSGTNAGFSQGVRTGVSIGVDKLAADLDKADPQWRWRGIFARVGKPGQRI